jgi:hypothetical protein
MTRFELGSKLNVMLAGVPAEAFALFLGDFFEEREGVRTAVLGAGGENCVE